MKSSGSHGDAERARLASGPARSLLSLLSAEKKNASGEVNESIHAAEVTVEMFSYFDAFCFYL